MIETGHQPVYFKYNLDYMHRNYSPYEVIAKMTGVMFYYLLFHFHDNRKDGQNSLDDMRGRDFRKELEDRERAVREKRDRNRGKVIKFAKCLILLVPFIFNFLYLGFQTHRDLVQAASDLVLTRSLQLTWMLMTLLMMRMMRWLKIV